MKLQLRSKSVAHTEAIAAALARRLRAGDVVGLTGPLGAGKTCFVRGMARGLGLSTDLVSSPTFVLCQEYDGPDQSIVLVHVDAYRLTGPDDLATIGWDDLVDADAIILAVEWPGRIGAALPAARFEVMLEHAGPTERSIVIEAPGALATRLRGLDEELAGLDRSPACPSCGEPMDPAGPFAPFCSQRCRLADLGQWFKESYRVSRPIQSDDLE